MKKYIIYLVTGASIIIESFETPQVLFEKYPGAKLIVEWHEPHQKTGHPIEESNKPNSYEIINVYQISGNPTVQFRQSQK